MDSKNPITIKDIAEQSGVSPSTVSLVLNNKGGVGDETRRRILEIADEMGYKGPALKRRSESSARTICFLHIIRHGHILNRDHDVFISDYIEGLSLETQRQDSILHTVTFKSVPVSDVVYYINQSDAEGFVILATELEHDDILSFAGIRKPIVFLDAFYQYLNFNFVDMNNTDIIYNALNYLHSRGHREIGLISGSPVTPNFKLREYAFRKVMAHLDLALNEEWVISIDSLFEEGYKDFRELLPELKALPSAFLCCNDILAASSLKAVKEFGLRVPNDVSLLGIDDLPLTRQTNPPLSTYQVSKERLGRIAVQILINKICNNKDDMPVKIQISGKLIERESIRQL